MAVAVEPRPSLVVLSGLHGSPLDVFKWERNCSFTFCKW